MPFVFLTVICICFFFPPQVPDNAVMALVPKQVTAYNSVNNSTVSRTSASKYGKRASTAFSVCASSRNKCKPTCKQTSSAYKKILKQQKFEERNPQVATQ